MTDPAEAAAQALSIVQHGCATAFDGSRVAIRAESVCFHGDTPGAPTIVAAARAFLERAGFEIRRFAA
ncbi:MAG: LamB/YcsF family protein [Chloroflexi bacterium]|nr:LamB/YcsF family protein [Chloroflexota bacterium]